MILALKTAWIWVQSNLSTKATLGTDESGRCGEVAITRYVEVHVGGNMTIFLKEV